MSADGSPHRPAPALVSHVHATHGPSLSSSLHRLVAPFGGWRTIVAPGERVAVKVNLLRPAAPEEAVCTHPETLSAVLAGLLEAGAEPFVADSPGGPTGFSRVERAFRMSGIAEACAELGVPIARIEEDRVSLPAPKGRLFQSFPVARAFRDADAIIQVGVLKTHQLMRITGGVKLTFGCIPGLTKAEFHVRAQRRDDFADLLLDLHLALRPRFTIIDGIIAMEGQGPGSGTPRRLNSLFAAHDAIALDAALADRIDHDAHGVFTLAAAARRDLIDLHNPYTAVGDPIERERGFRPAHRDAQELLPPPLHRATRNLVTARPRLTDPAACTRCGICAATCGAKAITMDPLPTFDDKRCVRCYACTEMCPTAAIDNVTPPLARFLLGRRRRTT